MVIFLLVVLSIVLIIVLIAVVNHRKNQKAAEWLAYKQKLEQEQAERKAEEERLEAERRARISKEREKDAETDRKFAEIKQTLEELDKDTYLFNRLKKEWSPSDEFYSLSFEEQTKLKCDFYEQELSEKYKPVWEFLSQTHSEDSFKNKRYNEDMLKILDAHKENLNSVIQILLQWLSGKGVTVQLEYCKTVENIFSLAGGIEPVIGNILVRLICLKIASNGDEKFNPVILKIMNDLEFVEWEWLLFHFIALDHNSYGEINIKNLIDDWENFDESEKQRITDKLFEETCELLDHCGDNSDGYYTEVIQMGIFSSIYEIAMIMWSYARRNPFDKYKFEKAYNMFCLFTSKYHVEFSKNTVKGGLNYQFTGVNDSNLHPEAVLAEIYSKKIMGGDATAKLMRTKINSWMSAGMDKDDHQNPLWYEMLASGLAWMELYDLELEVLHMMVKKELSISPGVQERLSFLENGGTSNLKVYELEPSDEFLYDSSSENWNVKDYDVFFRKVGMKKVKLNYSLVYSSWKKTLPLTDGQKVNMDDVYAEFQELVEDFDNEVSCCKKTARAVDLANVVFSDAVLFEFHSERNRCITMLFSCEKFGRNLNITILTFFTPESALSTDELQKYSAAIKTNIYIESFRETILQAVDDALKVHKEVYDDDSAPSSKKFIE